MERSDLRDFKFIQRGVARWWTDGPPQGKTFESPAGISACTRLRGRFVRMDDAPALRAGVLFPRGGEFLVQDSFGDASYPVGAKPRSELYTEYNGVRFYRGYGFIPGPPILRSRDAADRILDIESDGQDPPPVAHVCAFRSGARVSFTYYLELSPVERYRP